MANSNEALREALEIAKKAICNHARASHTCDSLAWENSTINANCGDILCSHRDLCEAKTTIQKALALPRRNCDVGTAEEQAKRYGRYCDKFTRDGMHCETCPCCGKIPFGKCEFAWSQMPYEAEVEVES